MCIFATRDDKFEIDLSAGLRTIPSKAPLFGSFKLQLDVFECDARLYQALLHNNPLAIGLNANQVKFPKIRLTKYIKQNSKEFVKTANNSLLKYLGISGIGTCKTDDDGLDIYRDFDATPVLAYYDIFKNYYANKQEEKAYQIGHNIVATTEKYEIELVATYDETGALTTTRTDNVNNVVSEFGTITADKVTTVLKTNKVLDKINIDNFQDIKIEYEYSSYQHTYQGTLKEMLASSKIQSYEYDEETRKLSITYNTSITYEGQTWNLARIYVGKSMNVLVNEITLKSFDLKEIDDMRMDILSFHSLGESFIIDPINNVGGNETSDFEFIHNAIQESDDEPAFEKNLAGILVKTYQNDIYNNWLKTEWIDGDNGINAITAISTSSGKIEIDAINFSEKLYNLLNRVAASDGTYYGYLNAAYTDSAKNFKETPIWLGGYSDEIIFEEIIQTAPTEGQPLGTLGGRGNLIGKHKGGKIVVKVDEPAYIIGIASITPRVTYSQGNEWYMTEIDSLADIHVPAMDGIGFENLLAERMHAGATIINENSEIEERQVVGKIPAWLNYMTAVDKSYGDFAADGSGDFMVLNRDYNCDSGELIDATTYSDPAKFNYAFAYTKTDAQNFWLRIHSDIKARRLMSAKQIPSV